MIGNYKIKFKKDLLVYEVKEIKILNFSKKWLLINILFLNYSFVYSASIPLINSIPLLDDNSASSYILYIKNKRIESIKHELNTTCNSDEICKYRVMKVSSSIINLRIINHINNAVNLLNNLAVKINYQLNGRTHFSKYDVIKRQNVIVDITENIALLIQKILTLNLFISKWTQFPYMLHKYFESIYYIEDSILNFLNITSHVSYYELKLVKCIFFDPVGYYLF